MSGTSPQSSDFTATGTIAAFVVPQTGTYYIAAYGGQSGSGATTGDLSDLPAGGGGLGGEAAGDSYLIQGETLDIAVAGAGFLEGGGGGSFVVLLNVATATPLIVAGGGSSPGAAGGEGPPGSDGGSDEPGGALAITAMAPV